MPGLFELLDGRRVSRLADADSDVLRRARSADGERTAYVAGRTVVITGAVDRSAKNCVRQVAPLRARILVLDRPWRNSIFE